MLLTGLAASVLVGCNDSPKWHATDMSGTLPPLAFTMTRAEDGKEVTAQDYRGKVVLLYFGYTFCPDVCPLTLTNIAQILTKLGKQAEEVRVLFVTVDPNRDTPAALKDYVSAFAPQIDGLRGTPDQLAALAKRYRAAYSVRPASDDHAYEVSHGSAVYVFDRDGKIRLLFSSLSTSTPQIENAVADLSQLIGEAEPTGFFGRILQMV